MNANNVIKKISIVTICYNEQDNIREFYNQLVDVFHKMEDRYTYEIIIADNSSTDQTPTVLRDIAAQDPNFKVIFNSRNFGVNRSGNNAFRQASGDAIILMVSDLQEPPSLIPQFLEKWESGYKIVMGVKYKSEESRIMFFLRSVYYNTLEKLSDIKLISHFTGFGLYDKQIYQIVKNLNDPYPYFRGLISDIGFEPAIIEFVQPVRKGGKSKSNFFYLYEEAMLGLTSYTKIPLRLATMTGFAVAMFSLLIALGYFIYKLIFWNSFQLGMAPLVIGLFFFSSIQLFFIGIIGEYLGTVHTHVLKRPLVIEKERINFD